MKHFLVHITRHGRCNRHFGWEICRQDKSLVVDRSTKTYPTLVQALTASAEAACRLAGKAMGFFEGAEGSCAERDDAALLRRSRDSFSLRDVFDVRLRTNFAAALRATCYSRHISCANVKRRGCAFLLRRISRILGPI